MRMSSWVLSISMNVDFADCSGNFSVFSPPQSKSVFLHFNLISRTSVIAPLPLVLSLGTPGKSLSLYTLPLGICVHWWDLPWGFSSPDQAIPTPSAFLFMTDASVTFVTLLTFLSTFGHIRCWTSVSVGLWTYAFFKIWDWEDGPDSPSI